MVNVPTPTYFSFIFSSKGTSMNEVGNFPDSPVKAVRRFMNKSMNDMTFGDNLIIYSATIVISTVVPLTIYGWVDFLKNKNKKPE